MNPYRRARKETSPEPGTGQRSADGIGEAPGTRRRDTAPVIVGTDGSACGRDAVDWAAAEAASRGCPLRVIHALSWPVTQASLGALAVEGIDTGIRDATEQILSEAVNRARTVAPGLAVSGQILLGSTVPAILRQARGAELLILGTRGLSASRGLLRGSVSVPVAARAGCPVVIVRAFQDDAPGWSATRVVAGVDFSKLSGHALGFAFEAASQRRVGLTAVHVWAPSGRADQPPVDDPAGEIVWWEQLSEALEPWRTRFPEVDVQQKLLQGHAGRTLVDESAGAALLVIGARRRGALRGKLLGSACETVLRQARCPVAVLGVRPPR